MYTPNRRLAYRRAFTLVELAVVLTLTSILLSVLATSLHILLTAKASIEEQQNHARSVARFAFQFRADVHDANSATIEVPGKLRKLRLHLGKLRFIDYFVEKGTTIRYRWQSKKLVSKEQFRLDEESITAFELTDQPRQFAAVVVTTGKRATRIEAIVGRDHRFATGAE